MTGFKEGASCCAGQQRHVALAPEARTSWPDGRFSEQHFSHGKLWGVCVPVLYPPPELFPKSSGGFHRCLTVSSGSPVCSLHSRLRADGGEFLALQPPDLPTSNSRALPQGWGSGLCLPPSGAVCQAPGTPQSGRNLCPHRASSLCRGSWPGLERTEHSPEVSSRCLSSSTASPTHQETSQLLPFFMQG